MRFKKKTNAQNYTCNCRIKKRNHNKIFNFKISRFILELKWIVFNLVMWTENDIWWKDYIFYF